jgi:hypothetical protein
MYWDVVEVKPEPNYSLFVRFKDGASGRVHLFPEQLTGVLAPLRDAQFFAQVFIDNGAVAWPGDIDLAPDAMHRQIATRSNQAEDERSFRDQLPRFYELKDLTDPSHKDAYFQNLEKHLRDPDGMCLQIFLLWEKELDGLDPTAWDLLKGKASRYLMLKDQKRGWQQLFDSLGEACAYNFLKESRGCSSVRFIPESDNSTPDLEGSSIAGRVFCEVKTINISDIEADARHRPGIVRGVEHQLTEGFLRKLDSDIAKAKKQLQNYASGPGTPQLIYVNICFDDWSGVYKEDYIQQIRDHISRRPPGVEIVARTGALKEQTQIVS